jgi:DNA topoisomerase-1
MPHKIPLIYENKKIILDPDSEEYATIYAKFIDTEYIKNKKFNINFFNDWKVFLKKAGFTEITNLNECDFSLIYQHLLKIKDSKKNLTKELKLEEKKKKINMKINLKLQLLMVKNNLLVILELNHLVYF